MITKEKFVEAARAAGVSDAWIEALWDNPNRVATLGVVLGAEDDECILKSLTKTFRLMNLTPQELEKHKAYVGRFTLASLCAAALWEVMYQDFWCETYFRLTPGQEPQCDRRGFWMKCNQLVLPDGEPFAKRFMREVESHDWKMPFEVRTEKELAC